MGADGREESAEGMGEEAGFSFRHFDTPFASVSVAYYQPANVLTK